MTQLRRLEELVADGSVWRMRQLAGHGITGTTVMRALAAGKLERVSRGTYRRSGAPYAPDAEFAEALARAPRGLVCLFSAAAFHGLGTVNPAQVWVALPHGVRSPRLEWPPVRWLQWRGSAAFTVGVSEQLVCGIRIRITNRARTVIDMMRMGRLVGEDRALEVLGDYVTAGGSMPELKVLAQQLHVERIMSPFLKAFAVLEGNQSWIQVGSLPDV